MQSAGSSTDGLATKVLWRMLMTGLALHRKHADISTRTCLRPGWGSSSVVLAMKAMETGLPAGRVEGRRPLFTVALAHRSSTTRSDRLPTSRSGYKFSSTSIFPLRE